MKNIHSLCRGRFHKHWADHFWDGWEPLSKRETLSKDVQVDRCLWILTCEIDMEGQRTCYPSYDLFDAVMNFLIKSDLWEIRWQSKEDFINDIEKRILATNFSSNSPNFIPISYQKGRNYRYCPYGYSCDDRNKKMLKNQITILKNWFTTLHMICELELHMSPVVPDSDAKNPSIWVMNQDDDDDCAVLIKTDEFLYHRDATEMARMINLLAIASHQCDLQDLWPCVGKAAFLRETDWQEPGNDDFWEQFEVMVVMQLKGLKVEDFHTAFDKLGIKETCDDAKKRPAVFRELSPSNTDASSTPDSSVQSSVTLAQDTDNAAEEDDTDDDLNDDLNDDSDYDEPDCTEISSFMEGKEEEIFGTMKTAHLEEVAEMESRFDGLKSTQEGLVSVQTMALNDLRDLGCQVYEKEKDPLIPQITAIVGSIERQKEVTIQRLKAEYSIRVKGVKFDFDILLSAQRSLQVRQERLLRECYMLTKKEELRQEGQKCEKRERAGIIGERISRKGSKRPSRDTDEYGLIEFDCASPGGTKKQKIS